MILRPFPMPLLLASLGLAGACGRAAVELPAEEWLAAPADTVLTPFGQVPRAAPLDRDQWVVVASDWDAAVVIDFRDGGSTPLGAGSGRDFLRPVDLFRAGDSVYVADWGLRLLTIWDRDGRRVGEAQMPDAIRGIFPKARDAAGRYYFEPPLVAGPDGLGLRDSGVVVRSDAGLARFDTVARLAPPEIAEVTRDQRSRFERAIHGAQDRWGVLPDGSVWVARTQRNRVWWIDPTGATTQGPQLPDPVFEVTEVDREDFISQFPPALRTSVEGLPFAMVKPPFEGAFTGPDGHIWFEKSRGGADSARRVHVVDRAGQLARWLVVPTRGRIIGVADSALLVAEQWGEGVRLLRVMVPPAAPPLP